MEVNLQISDWAVDAYTWYKQQKKNIDQLYSIKI